MPRYFCDYCDAYLTHDSAKGRKQHNYGWKHRENYKNYYISLLKEIGVLDMAGRPVPGSYEAFGVTPPMPRGMPPPFMPQMPLPHSVGTNVPPPGGLQLPPGLPPLPPGMMPPPGMFPPRFPPHMMPPPLPTGTTPTSGGTTGSGGATGGAGGIPLPPGFPPHGLPLPHGMGGLPPGFPPGFTLPPPPKPQQ